MNFQFFKEKNLVKRPVLAAFLSDGSMFTVDTPDHFAIFFSVFLNEKIQKHEKNPKK